MTQSPHNSPELFARVHGYLAAIENGQASPQEREEFESLICDDPEACDLYIHYMMATVDLRAWAAQAEEEVDSDQWSVASDADLPSPACGRETGDEGGQQQHMDSDSTPCPAPIILDISGSPSPLDPLPAPLYISHPCLYSNLFALLVIGIGTLGAWFYQIDIPRQLAQDRPTAASPKKSSSTDGLEFVGRITGMVDAKWADINTSTERGNNVPLGRIYALSSGLMEITYNTGAKVILQGPVTYKVDSRDGGYLSIGKLTARLEKKQSAISGQQSEPAASGQQSVASKNNLPSPASGRGAGGEGSRQFQNVASETNPKSQIAKSQISNPPLSTLHAPLFTIKTPTAIVTDLGTEFGVEVNEAGATASHVFQGKIRVQVAAVKGKSEARAVFLGENESVRIERPDVGNGNRSITLHRDVANPERFVRVLPLPKKKPLLRVLEHFRLGEDDLYSVAGQPADDRTVNNRHTQYLEKHGSPMYAAGLAERDSLLAMNFTGATNECFFKPDLSMSPTNNFILEAWARPNQVPNELVQLVCNGQSGRNGYGLVAKCGKWGFLVCNLTCGGFGVACEPGKWTHLALVCERKKVQFWVNGRPDGPSRHLAVSFPDGPFAIGGYPGGPLNSFDGQIDDVRLSEFRGPFSPEMLLFTAAANPPSSAADLSQASRAKDEPAQIHTHVALSNPNNVAPLATPTTSSSVGAERGLCFLQIGNAFDGKVHSSTWETPGGADADGTSFIFGDSDDSPTLDLSWEQPQHLKSLQTYVCAGGTSNGVTDFDRAVATVKFFVDRGAGWELAGTVSTANTNDVGAFDLVKLDGDWSNVMQVRYQFPKAAGGCSGPRVAEVLAIAGQDADRSATQRVIVPRDKGL